MHVHIDTIGPGGFDFEETIESTWLQQALGHDSPYRPCCNGHLKVRLVRKRSDMVRARGHLKVTVEADCVRCLSPVPIDLEIELDVVLVPLSEEPPAASDGELSQEDVGVATYRDRVIDLQALVRDEIFLEMPMSPVCSAEDMDACERFMADVEQHPEPLQVGEASSDEVGCDPRWAALRALKRAP